MIDMFGKKNKKDKRNVLIKKGDKKIEDEEQRKKKIKKDY